MLSFPRIVFMVVAAAAPLAALIGTIPISVGKGNGAGVPGAFLVATLTLLCFAVGYAQMSRRIVNTGAFYTFVTKGAGKPAGVAAAFVALLAYTTFAIGLAALFGFFSALAMESVGVQLSWIVYAVAGIAVTAVLGYRSIDLSSKVLGTLMVAEITVLAIFDVSVLAARGWAAVPMTSFAPSTVFVPGFAIALMFAYTSFVGFESAALYGEEAREPAKTIPAATYAAVLLIGIFYLLTVWVAVGAMGAAQAKDVAATRGGELMFELIQQFSGRELTGIARVLLCISFLAAYLAIHNAASRYIFALSREKLLPGALGKLHPTRCTPSRASAAVSLVTIALIGAFGAAGADPYQSLIPSQLGLGTLGIILLQAFTAVAIILYFRRQRSTDLWRTLVMPGIGAAGLIAATLLVADNFGLLLAQEAAWIKALPLVYLPTCIGGVVFALWLRRTRPHLYDALAAAKLRADARRRPAAAARYQERQCIVGAGPSGLLAARACKLEGIPYDHFERHADVGGIWDIDNPGSSMYESAHFISSKYTSGFFGFPMPQDYPDYPGHRQLHAYIRDFADVYGLREGVTFGCAVERAEPLGEQARDGWRVRLANGETRMYRGVVCANGVTWHPNMPSYPGQEAFCGEVRHVVT
ncbi:MAG: amino acid permease, partial [Steroidobacteraceae bacterium]